MRHSSIAASTLGPLAFVYLTGLVNGGQVQKPDASASRVFTPAIPKTWDDAAMATLEVPLADPVGSPKHVSADYYYRIPVRPIYKSYPVYAPGHEPPGYMGWLKQQEPAVIWDDAGHRPARQTQADWIKAGEMVFDSPIIFMAPPPPEMVRQLYQTAGRPVPSSGVDPFVVYVIRQKGRWRPHLPPAPTATPA